MEIIANLFLYIDDGLIKSLGVAPHSVEKADEEDLGNFLKSRVAVDSAAAKRFPLPVDLIKAWLGIDACGGLPYNCFSYLHRTGKAIWLFEIPLQIINAPANPFVCFTPIVDSKPHFESIMDANPLNSAEIHTGEFDGIVKIDWLAAYLSVEGLNIHDLLADDFTEAIKLLYLHKRYVAAMKLIMSFIDTIAYLEYGDVARNFETWLTTFATLGPIGVTPEELWEFRNSILHMTNPLSRKVKAGKVLPLYFYVDRTSKSAIVDQKSGTKMFPFDALYESIIEGLDKWTKSHNGDLKKQLTFIERYDTILSEGRPGTQSKNDQ